MALDLKSVLLCNLVLQMFDLFIFELEYITACGADEMVVMLLASDGFVSRLSVTEIEFFSDSAFGKKLQRPVHGSIADIGMFFSDFQIQFFGGKVGTGAQKVIKDDLSLPGRFQTLLGHELFENLFTFHCSPF